MRLVTIFAWISCSVVVGCAHRAEVSRRIDDTVVRGPYFSPSSWEDAVVRALDERHRPAEATELAIALDRGDVERAHAEAMHLVGASDARVAELVGVALVRAGDSAALESFVARHASDPAFVASWSERRAMLPESLAAAVARGLAATARHRVDAALALARAGRLDEARALASDAAASNLEERLSLAETALLVGDAEHGLELARDAYAAGASTRARSLEARCLRSLGRDGEAAAIEAELDPASSGALAETTRGP